MASRQFPATQRFHKTLRFTAVAAIFLGGCATLQRGSVHGIPHFQQVDEGLYRGGQPSADGFRHLSLLGVKTIISLRAEAGRRRIADRRLVESLGMKWVQLPMHSLWRPSDAQVRTFLRIALETRHRPVFLFCRRGEDRTGALIAIYRIVHEGWEPQRAYEEALSLGLARWNPFMRQVILHAQKKYGPQPLQSKLAEKSP